MQHICYMICIHTRRYSSYHISCSLSAFVGFRILLCNHIWSGNTCDILRQLILFRICLKFQLLTSNVSVQLILTCFTQSGYYLCRKRSVRFRMFMRKVTFGLDIQMIWLYMIIHIFSVLDYTCFWFTWLNMPSVYLS